MLRYRVHALVQILVRPKAKYSTAVMPDENVLYLVEKLSKEFSDISDIMPALRKSEDGELKNIHFDVWKRRICFMQTYNFTPKQCFRMISKYPPLLKMPVRNFESTIENWYSANLGFNNFNFVLMNVPELISVNVSEIEKRLPYLNSLFKNSNGVSKLLINSPNVMYDNWANVLSKIQYLRKMRFTMNQITEACALSKSTDFIKFRLDLLEKCGIFKQETRPIHKINKNDKTMHRNPHLKDILSKTNCFLKIAKISHEEYAACKDLYMLLVDDDDDDDDNVGKINTYVKIN